MAKEQLPPEPPPPPKKREEKQANVPPEPPPLPEEDDDDYRSIPPDDPVRKKIEALPWSSSVSQLRGIVWTMVGSVAGTALGSAVILLDKHYIRNRETPPATAEVDEAVQQHNERTQNILADNAEEEAEQKVQVHIPESVHDESLGNQKEAEMLLAQVPVQKVQLAADIDEKLREYNDTLEPLLGKGQQPYYEMNTYVTTQPITIGSEDGRKEYSKVAVCELAFVNEQGEDITLNLVLAGTVNDDNFREDIEQLQHQFVKNTLLYYYLDYHEQEQ